MQAAGLLANGIWAVMSWAVSWKSNGIPFVPFQFGDLDPSSAEFFLQEERLAQMRSEYERQCRVSGAQGWRPGTRLPVFTENILTANSRAEQRYNAADLFFYYYLFFLWCNGFFTLIQALGRGWKALAVEITG